MPRGATQSWRSVPVHGPRALRSSERALRAQDEEDEKEAALEKEKFEAVKAKVGVLLCRGMLPRARLRACLVLRPASPHA